MGLKSVAPVPALLGKEEQHGVNKDGLLYGRVRPIEGKEDAKSTTDWTTMVEAVEEMEIILNVSDNNFIDSKWRLQNKYIYSFRKQNISASIGVFLEAFCYKINKQLNSSR